MRHLAPIPILAILLSLGPAMAAEPPRAGGVGAHWNQVFLSRVAEGFGGGELQTPPGVMTCAGGTGFAVLKNTRLGGEGTGCFSASARMLQAGAQIGGHLPIGETYLGFYGGLGYGQLTMTREAPYQAHFVYVRPTMVVGLPLKVLAVEVGAYGSFPFLLAQSIGDERVYGGNFPHFGLVAAVIFGPHPRQREARVALPDDGEPSGRVEGSEPDAPAVEPPEGAEPAPPVD